METKEFIGKAIMDARKKKGLTQSELADLLFVSDKAVSNWETGKNYPDISLLQNISDCLDVDLLSLLTKKKDNMKKIKLLKTVAISLLVVGFFFLLIYFIFNYNKIKYYTISLNSEEYSISNSNLVIGNNKVILNLGVISPKDVNYDVSLYYLNNGERRNIVYEYDYDGMTLDVNYLNNIYFDKKMLNNLKDFYLEISYYDEKINEKVTKSFNLIFDNTIKSNKLFYKLSKKEKLYKKRTITLLENVGYKKSNNNTYIKNYKNEKEEDVYLTYYLDELKFVHEIKSGDMKKIGKLNIETNSFEYIIEYKNVVVEHFTKKDEVSCLIGVCDNAKDLEDEFYLEYNKIK